MQPATIRRLLVFGVCLIGVGALYLAPTIAGAPAGLGSAPARHDLPTATPTVGAVTGSPSVTAPGPTGPGTAADPATAPAPRTDPVSATAGATTAGTDRRTTTTTTRRSAATAGVPGRDHTPPGAVGRLSVTRLDPERLTITWPEPADDVGVVSYHVWLNGFLVLDTQQRRASLAWFNDSGTHVVQVQALDAVGNQGPSSPTLLVVRPSPTAAAPDPSATTHAPSPGPSTTAGEPTRAPALAPPAPTGSGRPSDLDQEDSP